LVESTSSPPKSLCASRNTSVPTVESRRMTTRFDTVVLVPTDPFLRIVTCLQPTARGERGRRSDRAAEAR